MLQLLVNLLLLASAVAARPSIDGSQHVLDTSAGDAVAEGTRKLRGKFLHITDIHPDPFFRTGSDPDGEHPCHRGKGRAGYFGAEATSCDSPISLINATFDWIKHNVRDEVDFVIWTGDSARHDNDELYPRTNKQVEQLNEFVVTKFDEVFGKPDNKHDRDPTNDFMVPIIPTFGNNDILPHNVLGAGPNRWTRKYLTIWEKFVPQEQRHSFARGGWFFTEVIPNKLAVFSLNTLYFFEANGAVDGCYNPNDPGYEHFDWLRIQLQFLRERGMKAILTGHVPPARTESKQNWDESCYQKYNLWLRQYRDVIVGNVYGHMNIDHFVLHDVKELTYKFKIPGIDEKLRGHELDLRDDLNINAKNDYLSDLRNRWKDLPRPPRGMVHSFDDTIDDQSKGKKKEQLNRYLKEIGGPFAERFSLSVISPSVVPNFFPSLRVVEYNITGLEHDHPSSTLTAPGYQERYNLRDEDVKEEQSASWMYANDFENDRSLESDEMTASKKKKKKRPRKSKPNFVIPRPPSRTAHPGPAYSPQTFSWLSWRQLYANLTEINRAAIKEYEDHESAREKGNAQTSIESLMKKHFNYELEYDTRDDHVYKLKDLTVRSWLGLAEKIGRSEYSSPYLSEDSIVDSDQVEQDMIEEKSARIRQLLVALEDKVAEGMHDWVSAINEIEQLMRDNVFERVDDLSSAFEIYYERLSSLVHLRDTHVRMIGSKVTEIDAKHIADDGEDQSKKSGSMSTDNSDDSHNDTTFKKHKKGKKRKGQTLKKNRLWHTFLRRAFVGTKSDEQLEEEFD